MLGHRASLSIPTCLLSLSYIIFTFPLFFYTLVYIFFNFVLVWCGRTLPDYTCVCSVDSSSSCRCFLGFFTFFSLAICWSFALVFFWGECRIYLENCWLVSFAVGQQLEQNKNRLEEQQKVHADSLAFEMAQLFPTRRVTLLWQFSVVLFKSVRVYIFLWETRRDLAGDRYSIISLSLSHTARHMKPMCPAIDTIVTVCPMPLFLDVLYTHKLFLMYLTFIDSIAIRWPMTIWNRRRPKGGEG